MTDDEKLQKLQKKWYDKLAREGFDDIERTHDGRVEHDSPYTKRHPLRLLRSHQRGTWHRNEEWYRLAAFHLHDNDWRKQPAWQKAAWEMLAGGSTQTDTYTYLKRRYRKNHPNRNALKKWFEEERTRMEVTQSVTSFERTAEPGEKVKVPGVLVEPVGDYRWLVEVPGGATVELDEDEFKY